MSDYGCCTMSLCIHEDDYESCDDCPFYDKDFFKEVENKMLIPVIKVKDKAHDGYIHIVGTNSHDSLILIKGQLEYYNLQNGCGTIGDDEYGYEFVVEEDEYLPHVEFVTLEEWIKLSMNDIDEQTKWLIKFYKHYVELQQKKVQEAREKAGIIMDTGGEIIE